MTDDSARDATLGGYLEEHERPPAFTGPDGHSYTVEILLEPMSDAGEGRFGAYLFFLKWRGRDPIGHVETDFISEADTEAQARSGVEELTLHEVKGLLDDLVSA